MFSKKIAMACFATSLTFAPVGRVSADTAGGFLAGTVVGGIIGNAIAKNQNRKRRIIRNYEARRNAETRASRAPRAEPAPAASVTPVSSSAPQKRENRDIQTSLNYFGFGAGTPDGILGRQSRDAISAYQRHMGFDATGKLNDQEKELLLQTYDDATNTSTTAITHAAQAAQLQAHRDQASRDQALKPGTDSDQAISVMPIPRQAPQHIPVAALQSFGSGKIAWANAQEPAAPVQGASLPVFMGAPGAVSLTSHCDRVNALTKANGALSTSGTMSDPDFTLNEQFCLARADGIAQGLKLAEEIQDFTPEQIAQQCTDFGPALHDYVAKISTAPHTAVMQNMAGFVLKSGFSQQQLADTAKICLSVGYTADDMDVALGSALILTVLGQQAYAELIGHHLSQGFGVSKRVDLALEWYDLGLKALEAGATPVFAAQQPERTALLRKASFALDAGVASGMLPFPSPDGQVPTFKFSD